MLIWAPLWQNSSQKLVSEKEEGAADVSHGPKLKRCQFSARESLSLNPGMKPGELMRWRHIQGRSEPGTIQQCEDRVAQGITEVTQSCKL